MMLTYCDSLKAVSSPSEATELRSQSDDGSW